MEPELWVGEAESVVTQEGWEGPMRALGLRALQVWDAGGLGASGEHSDGPQEGRAGV